MAKYRVDRCKGPIAPCGMNSLLYLGDDWRAANRAYDNAETGLDPWGQPNTVYGVALFIWDGKDWRWKRRKGLD